jgi:DNA-binding NtrC family response regulator
MKTAKGSILVVEDERIVRDSLSEWLMDEGYKVRTVKDGYEALKVINEGPVDVIVLDMKMPGLNGLEVLKELRARGTQARVIIITAYGSIENAVEAMKLGAVDYITKPFPPESLKFRYVRLSQVSSPQ